MKEGSKLPHPHLNPLPDGEERFPPLQGEGQGGDGVNKVFFGQIPRGMKAGRDGRDRMAERISIISNQKGASIIAVIAIMLILAVMGAALVSLVTTGSDISVNQLQSEQALNVAEGGKEYILANGTFPNYSTQGVTIPLGGTGSTVSNFKVDTPAYLSPPGIDNIVTTIPVNSTANFPVPGRIVIDSEVIAYTGTDATPSFTGATRGAGGTTAAAHASDNAVYPVTTLSADPGTTNPTSITVTSTVGYLIPGVIKIDEEYIYCTGTNAPATTQFTGCARGYQGSTIDTHPIGRNVFQYVITSTGTVGSAQRVLKNTETGTGESYQQGSFTKPVASGSQSITGVGFQPKAVIFFWTRQTGTGFDVGTTSINEGVGFASGPANQQAVSTTARRAAKSDEGRRYSQSYAIIFLNGGGPPSNTGALANLVSMDTDGFTLNWSVWGGGTYDANGYIVKYIALGGDITNALADTFSLTTAAGNQVVSPPLLTFQPDFIMFLWFTAGAASYDTNLRRAQLGIGFAQSAASQAALVAAGNDNTGNNADKRWQQRTDSSILLLSTANPPAQYAVASLVSLNANGFTLSKPTLPAAATPIFYLALKGGTHKVGSFKQAIAGGSQTTTGVGFQPEQLILASRNLIATITVDGLGAISIGAAQSSANSGSLWFQDRSDQDNTANQMNMYNSTTDVITLATAASTLTGRADFTSFVSDGFTLNWTSTDGTERQIIYWAIGPNIARSGANISPSNLDWREVY